MAAKEEVEPIMLNVLESVLAGVMSCELKVPEEAAPEGAILIGELSDELKQVVSKLFINKHEAAKLRVEINFAREDETRQSLIGQYERVSAETRLLQSILDYGLRAEFGIYEQKNVRLGIDNNWVVFREPECGCPACRAERGEISLLDAILQAAGYGEKGDCGCSATPDPRVTEESAPIASEQ